MLQAMLALLLLRADASSYGFLSGNRDSPLVHARGYADINVTTNKSNTMHNKVLCPRMDNLSTHTLDGHRMLLTTPLHASQLEEVHPRVPAVLTNMPDINPNITGQDPLSTTGDQLPRLDNDTSHYYDANAICVATNYYDANAICVATNHHSKSEGTSEPPRRLLTVLDDVLEVYQYYVRKPPPEAQSRRRERYQLRIAQLASKPGARKKRCRLGSPGTPNSANEPINNNNSSKSKGIGHTCGAAASQLCRILLICAGTTAYLEYAARHYNMGTDLVYAASLAYAVSATALLYASTSIAISLAFVWTVPTLAAVLICCAYTVIELIRFIFDLSAVIARLLYHHPLTHGTTIAALVVITRQGLNLVGAVHLHPTSIAAVATTAVTTFAAYEAYFLFVRTRIDIRSTIRHNWPIITANPTICARLLARTVFRKGIAIAMVTPAAAVGATRQVFFAAYRALRITILWLTGPNANGLSWLIILGYLAHSVMAAGDETTNKSRPPQFSGERAGFTQWVIAFTIWVACYVQECSALLDGEDPEPPIVKSDTPDAERDAVQEAHDKWAAKNRKLFGALGMAMPVWLMQSLYTSCRNNGVVALRYLNTNFASVAGDGNDRAAAIQRLQKPQIDSKSDISEQDVRGQYDSMMLAVADLKAAGATSPDEAMLISMFENALPQSYSVIRQMVRRNRHATLLAYYNDVLSEVRAEVHSRGPTAHAFSAAVSPGTTLNTAEDSMVSALVSALQTMGYNKTSGRNSNNRGNGNSSTGRRDPYPSEPCINCGLTNHTREKCIKKKVTCRFCGKIGHLPAYCPHNPTSGGKRKALTPSLRATVDREAGPTPLPNVTPGAPGTSASHAPSTYAAAVQSYTESEAQAHAAAAAAAHSDPSAMAAAYVAALASCGYANCARVVAAASSLPSLHPIRALQRLVEASKPTASKLVQAMVDSMATYFVVNKPEYLVRITNNNPGYTVLTADGAKPILAVGVVHVWIPDAKGVWMCYEVPNVLLMPACAAILYSVRVMRDLFGFKHDFESNGCVDMPNRASGLPIHDSGTAFSIPVAFSTTIVETSRLIRAAKHHAASLLAVVGSAFPADSMGTPQSLLYQRLAFPYAQAWRYVGAATRGHNLPPNAVMNGTLPVREAVMRGRARALPFFAKPPADLTPPPPGAVIFMDFAGPLLPSFPHGLTTYCGAIDAGSVYGRIMAAHTMTRDIATQTLQLMLADIAAKMKSAVPVKPFVVNCDNGSAFISKHFREFLADKQIALRFSPPYTPQLNAQIESMWCTTFATARVLLAAASLPPSMHPFAMQTARWIENRLPKPTRGNQTPVYMLSKELPDLSHLYSFGCLCLVTLPHPLREGDKHFMDRGAPGIYLGPSEEGLCHLVYVFALRRVLPTAKIRVWEDEFPGLRGDRYRWFPDVPVAGPGGHVLPGLPPPNIYGPTAANNNATANNNVSPDPPPTHPPLAASPPTDATPTPPPRPDHPATAGGSATASSHNVATTSTASHPTSNNVATIKLTKGDSGSASDPQSRMFTRELPARNTRASNPNYATLAGQAALAAAASVFSRFNALVAHSLAPPDQNNSEPYTAGPVMAFANHMLSTDSAFVCFDENGDNDLMSICEVAAYIFAASIVSTADYGDIPVPRGYKSALSGAWAEYWKAAIDKELAGLIALRTWDLIPLSQVPRGSNLMNCHYVFDVKRLRDATVEKFKARLVADGNTQKFGVDYDRIFATVIKSATIRLVLILAAALDYNLTQIDIRQAYLQAELPGKLYMRVPPGVPAFDDNRNPLVCRLNRSLYGLKQAGREWGQLFAAFLISWGFIRSTIDTCLFTYAKSSLLLWILVYVDDCIIVDNDSALRSRFVTDLGKRFPVDDRAELKWMLGVAIHRDRTARTLTLSQELYIKELIERYASHVSAGHTRKYDTPMEEGLRLSHDDCPAPNSDAADQMAPKKPIYMALVGAFLWLSNMTRSEIAHATSQLARFISNPGIVHFNAAMRVLTYLDGTLNRHLHYAPNPSLPLHVLVDSSWETKFSCSGAYYFFMGCPFHWFSKMQRSVTLSSAEAEFFGCMLALKDTLWIRQLLLDLRLLHPGPSQMWCDSKSAVAMAFDPVAFKNTKHILRAAEFLKDHVLRRSVTINHAKGSIMIADILTKGQARPVFLQLIKLLDDYPRNSVLDLAN